MNTNDIITIVSTVGFPIVACGCMAWYIKSGLDNIREIIHENTVALTRLTENIKDIERGVLGNAE